MSMVIIRDIFCQICIEIHVVTRHLNSLDATVQMRGHSIKFQLVLRKNIPQSPSNTPSYIWPFSVKTGLNEIT